MVFCEQGYLNLWKNSVHLHLDRKRRGNRRKI